MKRDTAIMTHCRVVALIVFLAAQGFAATWYVDRDNTAGPWDGQSWNTAFATIQEGIDAAYGVGGGEVWVKQGLYNERRENETGSVLMYSGVDLCGGFVGTELQRIDRIAGIYSTIDGRYARLGSAAYHVVVGADNATLDSFVITGGNANGGETSEDHKKRGGGMYNENASPTVVNCAFYTNSAETLGGGMFNFGSSPSLAGCTLSYNSSEWSGGGMANLDSSPTLNQCGFGSNWAERHGAGMYNEDTSSPSLTWCLFTDNSAGYHGGGMHNQSIASSPSVVRCAFIGNSANRTSGFGGGMCNGGAPTVTESVFSENSAEYGGGMRNSGPGSPVITRCVFVRNSAKEKGGGMSTGECSTTVSKCRFSGNWAGIEGGGVHNEGDGIAPFPVYVNCLIDRNSADSGGGMSNNTASPTVKCCTFARNGASEGSGMFSSWQSFPSVSNSILWNGGREEIEDSLGSLSLVTYSDLRGGLEGTGNIDVDPRFVDSAAGNFQLRVDSPCIDTGTNIEIPGDDINDDYRPYNWVADMGADEYDPATSDTEADGIPDAEDPDDDNDGIEDEFDIAPYDAAPEISPAIPALEIDEDAQGSFDLTAYETDQEDTGGALLWSISDVDEALFTASINQTTDVLTLTPVPDVNGSDVVGLTLVDSRGQTDFQDVTVTVTPVNDPPVCSTVGPLSFAEDSSLSVLDLDDYVSDVDNTDGEQTWTYSDNANILVSIDIGTHIATLSGKKDWFGQTQVVFRATDPGGLYAETTATLNVGPVNDPAILLSNTTCPVR